MPEDRLAGIRVLLVRHGDHAIIQWSRRHAYPYRYQFRWLLAFPDSVSLCHWLKCSKQVQQAYT